MIRFERQPPGTALTRSMLTGGGLLVALSGWLIVDHRAVAAGWVAALAGLLLLVGGHRANHGAGGPTDRMLDELLDRGWDAVVLGAIAWVAGPARPTIAIGALAALCLSYLSAYVRAKGASLDYSVEESHVTRGIRYACICIGLIAGWLAVGVWLAATVAALAALVRTSQVVREERG
jgi:hypothetical protein